MFNTVFNIVRYGIFNRFSGNNEDLNLVILNFGLTITARMEFKVMQGYCVLYWIRLTELKGTVWPWWRYALY